MDWNTLCRRDICERMLDIRMHPPKVIARCGNFAEQVTQFLPGVHLLLVCISCDGFLICPFLIPPNPMQPFLQNFVSDFLQEQMQVAHLWDTAFCLGENTMTIYTDEINWHIFWSQERGYFYKYQSLYQPMLLGKNKIFQTPNLAMDLTLDGREASNQSKKSLFLTIWNSFVKPRSWFWIFSLSWWRKFDQLLKSGFVDCTSLRLFPFQLCKNPYSDVIDIKQTKK